MCVLNDLELVQWDFLKAFIVCYNHNLNKESEIIQKEEFWIKYSFKSGNREIHIYISFSFPKF